MLAWIDYGRFCCFYHQWVAYQSRGIPNDFLDYGTSYDQSRGIPNDFPLEDMKGVKFKLK